MVDSFKERVALIKLPTYYYRVHVVVTTDVILSRNRRWKTIGSKDFGGSAGAMHVSNSDMGTSWIFLKDPSGPGTIAHECWHCIYQIMRYIGADIENEVVAYNLGYLVDKASACMHSQKRSICFQRVK